jgi:hypothetical protein
MFRAPVSTILPLILIAFLAGCATYGIETHASITANDFKSTGRKHRSDIEVFDGRAPTRPYREVATIKAIGTDRSTEAGLVEAMQIRAARIGADGLINLNFFTEPVTGGPTGSLYCPTWKECRYLGGDSYITSSQAAEATAIEYTETTGKIIDSVMPTESEASGGISD